ncbi:hypothetical protein [Nocardia sp. NBC_01388]|uniref:hypothetical protein n=1 Tax=Nocardia sp. NBC_01388 TaxID=2903596 RepID=UPI002F90F454
MIPRRDPGTQLPLLINPHDSAAEIDAPEMQALLETLLEGLKQWDGTDRPATPDGDDAEQDIRALMTDSIAAFAELGIRVAYRSQTD